MLTLYNQLEKSMRIVSFGCSVAFGELPRNIF